jgi:hypothetical protein
MYAIINQKIPFLRKNDKFFSSKNMSLLQENVKYNDS